MCGNTKIYDEEAKPILYFIVDNYIEKRERDKLEKRIGLIMKSLKEPQVKEIKLCTESEFMTKEINKILTR
jgi:hypothetical protein